MRKRKRPEVEMAPLIDVVFLLLIFFLLSSPFIMQQGIRVKLPQATTSEAQPRRDILILIDAEERVFLNDRRVSEGRLKDSLRNLMSKDGIKTAIIKADEDVRHGLVVEVMDVAKQAGIQRLAIATRPREARDKG